MLRLLIVEDNEMNRNMLQRRLTRLGFDVRVAGDGREALAAVRSARPDVVVMDLNLPGMDGWTATRELKAAPDTAQIPVIALTAHALSGDRQRAIDAGCDDYDTKPIDLPRLLAKIAELTEVLEAR